MDGRTLDPIDPADPVPPSWPPMMATTRPPDPAARELFDEMARWPIFDPHSHIDARRPAARNLDEVLGYHYYTELAHSAGMPADLVAPDLAPRERARNLATYLDRIDNTVQYAWLMEIARTFHGFAHDRITPENVDALYDRADHEADGPAWDHEVWDRTQLEAVFLTNDFDDPLEGWDTRQYVPCLRTDDLVLKLHEPSTVARLRESTGVDVVDYASLRQAIGAIFERFVGQGGPGLRHQPAARLRPPGLDPPSGRSRRSAGPCTRWTSGPTSTTRSARSSSGRSPSSAPSSGSRST